MNTKIFFSIIGSLLAIGIIGAVISNKYSSNTPGIYDQFAQCLSDNGAKFYGAFWCPHCQAEKKLFGNSVKLLPYIECSTLSGNDQTQICKDNKIESYPSWNFKNGINVTSKDIPKICSIIPGNEGEDPACKQVASKYFKTFIFSDYVVKSGTEPVHTGDTWQFDSSAFASGEIPLANLAKQSGCNLPLITK